MKLLLMFLSGTAVGFASGFWYGGERNLDLAQRAYSAAMACANLTPGFEALYCGKRQ